MQVGYGKVNITPDMSLPLSGYGNTEKRMSDGFTDYLYATCFAVTDPDGNTAILFGIEEKDAVRAATFNPACALGVLIAPDQSVQVAGGYLIQLLPGADDWVITCIEAGIGEVGAVSTHLANGLSAQEILEKVLSDFEMEVLESTPVEYRCYCSEERVSRALISMGRAELESLIEDQGEAELTCQFCDAVHSFTPDDIAKILKRV